MSDAPFGTLGKVIGGLILLFLFLRIFGCEGPTLETKVEIQPTIPQQHEFPERSLEIKPSEAPKSEVQTKRIEGIIKIEKMQVQLGGLNPIIISVKNEGNTPFAPDVNIRIKQDNQIICDVDPFAGPLGDEPIGILNAADSTIRKIEIMTCGFPRNGRYLIEAILINPNTMDTLDSDEQVLMVQDQLLQQIEDNCNMLKNLCDQSPHTCDSYELAKAGGQCP